MCAHSTSRSSTRIPGFVDGVVRDYGRLDVLVNNAGFAVAGFAEDIKLDELRLQFETNFFGAVAMTKAALPTMRRQHSGHIIQVSSIAGLHGSVTVSSYAASKHALEGWSESLRMEVNSLGIKVVLVEPGAFQTDIWTRGAVMGEQVTKQTSPNIQRSLRMRSRVEKLPKADPIAVARTHCCDCAGSESEAALSGRARCEDPAGAEAHSAVEVAREGRR